MTAVAGLHANVVELEYTTVPDAVALGLAGSTPVIGTQAVDTRMNTVGFSLAAPVPRGSGSALTA